MHNYLKLLDEVLTRGEVRKDRTGTGTIGIFGAQLNFDLTHSFPLVTTKKIFWKGVVAELLWMIRGNTNVHELQGQNVPIWNKWASADTGDLGPVYGKQWRDWSAYSFRKMEGADLYGVKAWSVDQLKNVVEGLRTDPYSRRHIVSAWNPADLDLMALPPCHALFQFYVTNDGHLLCHMYQRSADMFLGVPFNIASYALLTNMVAHDVGLKAGELIISYGDVHLYKNHIDQAKEQLNRRCYERPRVYFEEAAPRSIFDIRPEHIVLDGYDYHPALKGEVSV